MDRNRRIMIAGKDGVAGSAIVRLLRAEGYQELLLPSHSELDFCDQKAVNQYFQSNKPDYVFYTAAKMGSIIYRNQHPVDILRDNLLMQTNILQSAHENGIKKLQFMSSDFVYPNTSSGTLREEDFLSEGIGEKDLPYTLAKIAGIKLCDYYHQQFGDDFFTVVPCAFFGINTSFDLERANVVGALIRRFHDAKRNGAKEFVLWGSGKPVKEFLFCDDVARACLFLMTQETHDRMVNVGPGDGGTTIMELAQMIQEVVGFEGSIVCDLDKPDGIMRRVMDSSKLRHLGWKPLYTLKQGIEETYRYFLTTPYAN